jgi:hypothetical protein
VVILVFSLKISTNECVCVSVIPFFLKVISLLFVLFDRQFGAKYVPLLLLLLLFFGLF